ncbi:hypothetical protein [Stratiformator vulcanicus]|uniref:Uncharacterized protein n=1 Tax=Stratiformator vulcanicus TaxID=2527980 RepID=A0A517R2T2_9PLAN|nr:hypothetical protein [Stratiformator vulcanicus]QDT38161.1 hypothetical protein Pan189_25510 [Stratiformator vulcanicus]
MQGVGAIGGAALGMGAASAISGAATGTGGVTAGPGGAPSAQIPSNPVESASELGQLDQLTEALAELDSIDLLMLILLSGASHKEDEESSAEFLLGLIAGIAAAGQTGSADGVSDSGAGAFAPGTLVDVSA